VEKGRGLEGWKVGGLATEDRRQKTEYRRQNTEDRRQKTGDRSQKTEVRIQETEVRSQKSGDRRLNNTVIPACTTTVIPAGF